MILYLIRHGQSVANESGILQGCKEFPLSDLGYKQAELLGQFFASKAMDYIYSSDLIRAFDTAQSISHHHPIEVKKWEKIREVGLGPLEGKTRKELQLQFPELKDIPSILTTGIEGTETVEEITSRCKYVVEQLLLGHRGDKVVLVSHGGFISIFLMYLMFGENWNDIHRPFIIGNTGVSKIEFTDSNKPIFHYINNDAHLVSGNVPNESILY
ncbi:histidine phosphatase family protein [Anaerobacillus alkalidiazotrophicus]|uniref:Histidine phosphatase family protein n=1 Tax=Anaerobacillus alkalidiazotrophicus TaxID=472963 RepID=A0A1S2M9L0_9BACI|nr:histidine phosphatase family protein [Anaerobacillus alkalidiazotrophicus]OIJ21304.1 histidine phosphatase family protein [Anaerobacillus alkalidiazotrophicus]